MTDASSQDFDTAFRSLFLTAYRSAYRILRSREDAEDVAIEACGRAEAYWPAVRDFAIPWITRVSVNLSLDELKRRNRKKVANPDRQLASTDAPSEFRLDLLGALARLPKRQREATFLRVVGDLRDPDVATAMGISLGAAKQHIRRGMVSLRRSLASYSTLLEEDNEFEQPRPI